MVWAVCGALQLQDSPTSAKPGSGLHPDAFAIQGKGIALEVASYIFTMVGFDGDNRRRKGGSGLRLVVGTGPAAGTPRRSTDSLKLAGRHDSLLLVEGRRKLPRPAR